eukprot:TRINITY_DN78452_c0_g1_i1.p1 TRINITY_DN78452_c0_g1~~TRINITY_DN78452_c0_g1_i1.p1  ORF type:complete len:1154 (-),score=196.01 TRINITY_DN78452_c0_g1_i1:1370-4831(-)
MSAARFSSALPPRPRATPSSPRASTYSPPLAPSTPPARAPSDTASPPRVTPPTPPSPLLTAPFPNQPLLRAAGGVEADRAYLHAAESELLDEIQTVRSQLRLARQRLSLRRNRRLRRTASVGDDFAAVLPTPPLNKLPSASEKPLRHRVISVSLRLPDARGRSSSPRQLFDNALPPDALFTLRNSVDLPFVWVGAVNPSSPPSPANASTPSNQATNDRTVAFDEPLVEKTYRKRRHSRYSSNRDRNHAHPESRSVAVSLPEEPEIMERFHTFCEHILWRLLHYDYGSVGQGPELDEYFSAYRIVNQRFVETISEVYEDGDVIWVHNYHLMLLPSLLRDSIWYAKIGFFLYSPFPSAEIFRILPYRTEILRGVIGADLIGFYSYNYSKQFVASCSRLLGIDGTPSYIDADPSNGRRCEIAIYPAGIDAHALRNYVSSKSVKSRVAELRARFEGFRILVGVDRLDDSFGGIPLKLLAFEQLLVKNPNLRGRIVFIQIATIPRQARSTAAFRQQQMQVNELVGRINSMYGTFSFTPVHYINSELDSLNLYALMSVGHICIVSPVRDGMSLVPHEWTVCQQASYKGPIILSEFAGAAHSFSTALHVNPWNVDMMCEQIKKAIHMDEKERAMRNDAAYEFVNTQTAKLWGLNFLEDLQQCEGVTGSSSVAATPMLDFPTVIHAYLGLAAMSSPVPSATVLSSMGTVQGSGVPPHSPSEFSNVLLNTFGPSIRLPGYQSDQKTSSLDGLFRNSMSSPPGKSDGARISPEVSSSKLNSRVALFVLDLDGTLVPFQAIAKLGAPPQSVIDAIQAVLDANPLNCVLVTSSRDPNTVMQWLGELNVYLAAEDGAFFRAPGDATWTSLFRDASGHDFQSSRNSITQQSASDGSPVGTGLADIDDKRQPQPTKDDDSRKKRSSLHTSDTDTLWDVHELRKEKRPVPLQEGHHRGTSSSFTSISSSESVQNGEFNSRRPWKSVVMPAMQHFAERTPGVVIEVGQVTVTWHYIDSDTDFGRWQARDLFKHLESFLLQRLNIILLIDSHRRWIKVRPNGVDKSIAVSRTVQHIMDTEKSKMDTGQQKRREPLYIDFVLCIGDDKADEGMFDMLKDPTKLENMGIRAMNRVFTCRVGTPITSASYYLDSPPRVNELLDEISVANVRVQS